MRTLLAATLALLLATPLLPTPAQAQSLPRIAVVELTTRGGISSDEAAIISDRIRAQFLRTQTYEVMERSHMEAVLKEQGFSQTQSCESTDCSVQVGRLLAVRQIVTGSVSRLGKLYTLSLRIVDVERGQILKEEYQDCTCTLEEVLTRLSGNVVQQITQKGEFQRPQEPLSTLKPPPTRPQDVRTALASYQMQEKSLLWSTVLSIPLPFGYLYLDEPGWFWTLLGIQVGSLFMPFVIGSSAGSAATGLILMSSVGFMVVHAPTMAYFKNEQRMHELGLTPEDLRAQAPVTLPLLAFEWRL
jgi:TolB-like protein